MPTGSGSGIVDSHTFTPAAGGQLVVTITFECKGNGGSDWGASFSSMAFVTQGGTTTYGPSKPMSSIARASQAVRGVFSVTSGSSVEVGLYGDISGAVSADWWDIHVTAELIKL